MWTKPKISEVGRVSILFPEREQELLEKKKSRGLREVPASILPGSARTQLVQGPMVFVLPALTDGTTAT